MNRYRKESGRSTSPSEPTPSIPVPGTDSVGTRTQEASSPARTRILDAADALLSEEGPAGFSMRKAAGKLGLTATAIYGHFKDKDELLAAVLDRRFAAAASAWFSALPLAPDASPWDRTDALTRFYLHLGLSDPDAYRLRFAPGAGTDALLRRWAAEDFDEGDQAAVLFAALSALKASRGASAGGARVEGRGPSPFIAYWAFLHGLVLAYAPLDEGLDEKVEDAAGAAKIFLEGWVSA